MKIVCPRPLFLLAAGAVFACPQRPKSQQTEGHPHDQFDAAAFTGADICAKTNAAVKAALAAMKQPGIASMAKLHGRVRIPAGYYTCTSAIQVPHGVWISGDGDATFISWTGSGPAVVASEADVPGEYVQGMLSDLHIRGLEKAGQGGIFVGGQPGCKKDDCAANPATNIGYNYVFRNITIYNMGGNGIEYGHGAFNLLWDNVHANNNWGYGLYVPRTAAGGGQYNTWTHSQLSGNRMGGWFIDQLPFVTFEMFGMDVQYNVGNDGAPTQAEVTGGHVICTGCHFEHQQGAFFSLNSEGEANKGDDVQLIGGQLILVRRAVADPYLVAAAGAARFSASGTYIVTFHDVGQMIAVAEPAVASISVFGTTVSSVGARFGGITTARGQGVRYEQPIDTTTQVPNVNGPRYFGGITSFDTVHAGKLSSEDGFSGTCTTGVVVTKGIVTGCR